MCATGSAIDRHGQSKLPDGPTTKDGQGLPVHDVRAINGVQSHRQRLHEGCQLKRNLVGDRVKPAFGEEGIFGKNTGRPRRVFAVVLAFCAAVVADSTRADEIQSDSLAHLPVAFEVRPQFDDRPCGLVPLGNGVLGHRRLPVPAQAHSLVTKTVVDRLDVASADTRIGDLDLSLTGAWNRLRPIHHLDHSRP